jgi:hypothetical protein
MSEGIIQKVFKKYCAVGFEVDIDDNTINVIPQKIVEDTFRELIAEIEKKLYINSAYWDEIAKHNRRVRKILIGDNQE